jgi:feruloyl esterase
MRLLGLAVSALLALPIAAHAEDCAALAGMRFPHAHILAAEKRAAGSFATPDLGPSASAPVVPAFCRVTGEADPHIGFELWMPERGWNERFVALGSGGFGGTIDHRSLAQLLAEGYAVTANDTGHTGADMAWMKDAQARREWGHAATHDAVGPVRAIIEAYYGRLPSYSYFQGCSTGGAQAMEEAEFYPEDFDGIVATSPGMDYSHLMLSFLWGIKSATDHATLSEQKLRLLGDAVARQCASGDGLVLIADPAACHFNLAVLLCKNGQSDGCLTAEEVTTARLLYQGPRNPRTDEEIYPGFVAGSEGSEEFAGALAPAFGWSLIQGPLALQYAIPLLKNMVFGADWDWKTFDFDRDVAHVETVLHADIDSMNPDLKAFHAHNGKLIMIQGWGDPFNAQTLPIEYRERVIQTFPGGREGASRTVDGFFRLFMAPGMGHCLGGPGPSKTDALGALRAWVEKDVAPDRIVAEKINIPGAKSAVPPLTRPLCPYPKIAQWTGRGSQRDAENFVCKADSQ